MTNLRTAVVARRDLATTVMQAFSPVEHAAVQSAADAFRCVAVLIEQHRDAALPLPVAGEAIRLAGELALAQLGVREKALALHGALSDVAREIRMDEEQIAPWCPPNSASLVEARPSLALAR